MMVTVMAVVLPMIYPSALVDACLSKFVSSPSYISKSLPSSNPFWAVGIHGRSTMRLSCRHSEKWPGSCAASNRLRKEDRESVLALDCIQCKTFLTFGFVTLHPKAEKKVKIEKIFGVRGENLTVELHIYSITTSDNK
jgi:hypothetical protein